MFKDVNINSPVQDQVTEEFVTRTVPEGLNVNASNTVSKVIDGSKGGYVNLGTIFTAQAGKEGSDYAIVSFPAGSFSGSTTITMTIDDNKLTGTFSPSMTFSKPVILVFFSRSRFIKI